MHASEITTLKIQGISALEFKFDMLQEQTAHNYSDIEATFQQFNHNLSQRYGSLQICCNKKVFRTFPC